MRLRPDPAPNHVTLAIDQEVRGQGDVAAARLAVLVTHAEGVDSLQLRIAQDGKRQIILLDDARRLTRRVGADRQQRAAALL